MTDSGAWRVGPLAEASGLTVRTLHHWDTIGLLTPSRRTTGGHREYTEEDVARLYQVLALRSLGLGLESIGVCLDSGVDPRRVVGDHLAGVEESLRALESLRDRLRRLGVELAGDGEPTADALLDAVRATGGIGGGGAGAPAGEPVLRRHLDAGQLGVLRTRAAALGPALHYLLEIEWPELYRRAEVLRTAGAAPSDVRVRRIVRRLDELSTLFTGGDAGVSEGVREAWREDPAALSGVPDAPADDWRELAAFLDTARAGADGQDGRPDRRPDQTPDRKPDRKPDHNPDRKPDHNPGRKPGHNPDQSPDRNTPGPRH